MKRKMKLLDRYYSMPIIFDSIISISFCVVYNSLTLNQNLTLNDYLDLIKSSCDIYCPSHSDNYCHI